MRIALGLFALSAALIVAIWSLLGRDVAMPPSPLPADGKLYCLSYAPFHGRQTPLDLGTRVDPAQIEEDLTRLAKLTDCVRTYSTDFGLDRIAEIAQRHGLKVIQGLWLSGHADRNKVQIETAVALANRYSNIIAVVVGNEALLRGEISALDLANTVRSVKAQVPVPVTYADVWEYWLRNRDLASAVDFITIHILPYWEDFPIPADEAAAHVDSIRRKVAAAFPGKEILIGETGWPSHGRMREGALPSPANQARVLHDILGLARRENFHVNVVEAFDQPWKRALEGTVGGYWGLFDDRTREAKFAWGQPVSNHPDWPWQAGGGAALAALVFAAALFGGPRRASARQPPLIAWIGLTIIAVGSGTFVGWAVESMLFESFGTGGWMRSGALVAVAILAPLVAARAIVANVAIPSFAAVLAHADERLRDPRAWFLGAVFVALVALALQVALGLAFDPRYRDFPFAALTAASVPFAVVNLLVRRARGRTGAAEKIAAATLALSAVYVALDETFANWQSVWFCAVLLALAVILLRVRAAPG